MNHREAAARNRLIVAACLDGQSAISIAMDYGMSRGHVHHILLRAGVDAPPRRKANADRDEVIRSLRSKKRSLEYLADRFGLTKQRISQICSGDHYDPIFHQQTDRRSRRASPRSLITVHEARP